MECDINLLKLSGKKKEENFENINQSCAMEVWWIKDIMMD